MQRNETNLQDVLKGEGELTQAEWNAIHGTIQTYNSNLSLNAIPQSDQLNQMASDFDLIAQRLESAQSSQTPRS